MLARRPVGAEASAGLGGNDGSDCGWVHACEAQSVLLAPHHRDLEAGKPE